MAEHTLYNVWQEGDYWFSRCYGCTWKSEGCDTKRDAKAEHTDHVLNERLKAMGH
jgi:hypothetical protein